MAPRRGGNPGVHLRRCRGVHYLQSSSDAELERLLLGVGRAPDLLPRALLVPPAVELHVADADALALQGVPMVQRGILRIFFADPRWLRARYRMSIYTRMLRSEHGHWVRVNFVHHVYVYIHIYIYI